MEELLYLPYSDSLQLISSCWMRQIFTFWYVPSGLTKDSFLEKKQTSKNTWIIFITSKKRMNLFLYLPISQNGYRTLKKKQRIRPFLLNIMGPSRPSFLGSQWAFRNLPRVGTIHTKHRGSRTCWQLCGWNRPRWRIRRLVKKAKEFWWVGISSPWKTTLTLGVVTLEILPKIP